MADRPRILVIDDEVPIQELFKRRFNDVYEISCATFQDEALAALKSSEFDLVLLDLKLPRTQSDMASTTEVGVDILRQIRKGKLCRRASADQLPVVVMTAFGTDKVFSAEFLGTRGACDYVRKPFGDPTALSLIIERALGGEGALAAPLARGITVVQLRFNVAARVALVEDIPYDGAHYDLLHALHVPFLADQNALKPQASYRGLRSLELAAKWRVEDTAVRQRVAKFRAAVKRDFQQRFGRDLERNDIVENLRTWDGYRLNPFVVRLVAWEQEMGQL